MDLSRTYLGEKAIQQGIKYILNQPMENLGNILEWAKKIPMAPHHKRNLESVQEFLEDKDSNWYKFAEMLLTETDPHVKEKTGVNFFLNAALLGVPRQMELSEKLGIPIPFCILIDPTSRCNLKCPGCWAGDYSNHDDLEFELLDRVMTEAEELGIYMIIMSGGEPTIRKDDIIKLAEKHNSQIIHLFSNGTLIDDKFIEDMLRVGNISIAFSLEGFEESTDKRRRKGTFKKIMDTMDKMREAGLVFGASVTYTKENTEELASEEFVDMLIEKGVRYAWYFTYVPVGRDADPNMMATPKQRAYMFDKVLEYRRTKPIFIMDFWNDSEASNGCIAGGRRFIHITAKGDVEPCVFVHYANCNIRDVSLKEALASPIMMAYKKRQPFSSNIRRPCPLIDIPEILPELVEESGAYSTQIHGKESPEEFAKKLKPYAEEWKEIADAIWYKKHPQEMKN